MKMTKNVSLDVYLLYVMGKLIQELQSILKSGVSWKPIRDHLETLSRVCSTLDLKVMRDSVDELAKELKNKYWKDDSYLDYQDVEGLKSSISSWEGRLQEIMKNWILYYPDTHIDAAKLKKGLTAFLNNNEFYALETLERQGLDEATSSLLLDNFTSAEFIALRTAESLLKKWYEKKTGKKLGRTTWGEVLDKLSQEFPKEERPKELLLLDYLRERRNEIAHPEAVSTPEEASTTLFNVLSLWRSLYSKLKQE